MSLDVYLTAPRKIMAISSSGDVVEITRERWDAAFPGLLPLGDTHGVEAEAYTANITHNLGAMAYEAGIYEAIWRPEEIGITKASQLIEPLAAGLALLKSDRQRFEKHNPENGWGSYDSFVPWVERYLEACRENPEASVSVCR